MPESAPLEEGGPLPRTLGQERGLRLRFREVNGRRSAAPHQRAQQRRRDRMGSMRGHADLHLGRQVFGHLEHPRLGEPQHGLGLRRVPGEQLVEDDGRGEAGASEHRQMAKTVRHVTDRDRPRSDECLRGLRRGSFHRVRRDLAARGHQGLHPGNEALSLVQLAREMAQLEMAMGVHEARQEHARPEVAHCTLRRAHLAGPAHPQNPPLGDRHHAVA